jgi:thiamine pyrophosphate-dependent acetolactate synthase large subunit-like protein
MASRAPYHLEQQFWRPVEPAGLPAAGVQTIADALVGAREPLVITGYSGRNHATVGELVRLADNVKGLRVLDTGGSDMCFPGKAPQKCSNDATDSLQPITLPGSACATSTTRGSNPPT